MASNITEKIAEFVSRFDEVPLSEEAFHNGKVAVLDCIGVALAGLRQPIGSVMLRYAGELPAVREATVWGTKTRISSLEAAFVNGCLGHALDYDDCNRVMLGHPSTVLVPAVFALGEKVNVSGRRFLQSYIVGFEVATKLGKVLNPGLHDKGWHPTSTLGIMGSTTGASFLMGLSIEQTKHAIGIAASEASGIKKNFGSMVKPLHAGSAARKGVWATLLAGKGLVADPQALDGAFGFLDLFKGDMDYDPAPIDHLADPLEIVSSGVVIKQYPCCGSTHSLLDGIIDIKQREGVSPQQVKQIECRLDPRRIPHINRPQVQSGLEAKFSVQYCVAAGLIDGKAGFGQFVDENVLRPEVKELMEKVRIVPMKDLCGFGSELTVQMTDGRVISRVMSETKGSPALPLSDDEVLAKFVDCAMQVTTLERAKKAGEKIMSLERENDPKRILRLLTERK